MTSSADPGVVVVVETAVAVPSSTSTEHDDVIGRHAVSPADAWGPVNTPPPSASSVAAEAAADIMARAITMELIPDPMRTPMMPIDGIHNQQQLVAMTAIQYPPGFVVASHDMDSAQANNAAKNGGKGELVC